MNSASLLRLSGLFAVTASVFIGCGGRIEADYTSDGGENDTVDTCGNGKLDKGEQCDGTRLGGATCDSATMHAHPSGQLSCHNCHLVMTGCTGSSPPSGSGGATSGTGGRSTGTGGSVGTGTGGRLGTGGAMSGGGRTGTGGTATASCTSTADCRGREVCCGVRTNGAYAFSCAATCARTDVTAECHGTSDCGRGETCCGTTNQTGTTYTSIACAATCNANGERTLCSSNSDCPRGMTCGTSRVLPSGFGTCR